MTQEEIQLLLIDLSARLPYGVKFGIGLGKLGKYDLVEINTKKGKVLFGQDLYIDLETCKPYLRPMSSMTEEEIKEYKHLVAFSGSPNGAANFVDWLNKKMFSYRTIDGKDMFELGLALAVTEENNPYKD